MSMFDGDFDAEDATILGGVMGFAEESIREENKKPDEDTEDDLIVVDPEDIKEINLRLIRNMNPKLFNYVVSLAIRHTKAWRQARLDMEAVEDELEALAETEDLIAAEEDTNEV